MILLLLALDAVFHKNVASPFPRTALCNFEHSARKSAIIILFWLAGLNKTSRQANYPQCILFENPCFIILEHCSMYSQKLHGLDSPWKEKSYIFHTHSKMSGLALLFVYVEKCSLCKTASLDFLHRLMSVAEIWMFGNSAIDTTADCR